MMKDRQLRNQGWLLAGALGLVAFALVFGSTAKSGAGISSDSANYVSAADSLVSDGDLIGVGGQPLLLFPPAYPAMLALGEYLGLGVLGWGRLANAVLFGALVALCTGWLSRQTDRQTDRQLSF